MGSIPPELGDLSELEHLGLWRNNLTGSIPGELGKLKKLNALGARTKQDFRTNPGGDWRNGEP